jgi:hypothetical protein
LSLLTTGLVETGGNLALEPILYFVLTGFRSPGPELTEVLFAVASAKPLYIRYASADLFQRLSEKGIIPRE